MKILIDKPKTPVQQDKKLNQIKLYYKKIKTTFINQKHKMKTIKS